MMKEQWYNDLQRKYFQIISDIIKDNIRFYRINQTIKWNFGYDERVAIFAWFNKTTNVVTVNIAAVDYSFQHEEPLNIEYFLLHEIRHIYQHLEIEYYLKDPAKCNNADLAKKWAKEESNYVTALDKDGNENDGYLSQDIEMDAFAYAYAVMKYKYGEVNYLHVPKAYQNHEFNGIVTEWLKTFKSEEL